MLSEDSKEIYQEVENNFLHISEDSPNYKNDLLAPLLTIWLGVSFTNFKAILLRFIFYWLISIIIFAICLGFKETIPNEILAFLIQPLTFFIPCMLALLAPPSDSTFLKLSKFQVENIKTIIKGKRKKEITESYLNSLKENFQIIEKDSKQRNLLIKSLLAGIYLVGIYLVGIYLIGIYLIGIAGKFPIGGSFTMLSIISFLIFYLLLECHNSLKDGIFSALYCSISELKLELEDAETVKTKLLEKPDSVFSVDGLNYEVKEKRETNAKT